LIIMLAIIYHLINYSIVIQKLPVKWVILK